MEEMVASQIAHEKADDYIIFLDKAINDTIFRLYSCNESITLSQQLLL
jgi:hypothetical protein